MSDPVSFQSRDVGVVHPTGSDPVKTVADMRRTDARRRERDRPEGVTQGFHVSVYKVDPRIRVLARNLFSKDDCRRALADEVIEGWPQMPLVSKPASFACRAERLARAGSRPYLPVVRPAGTAQGIRPNSDAGEEMALCESAQFVRFNIFDTSFIYDAGGDEARRHQVAQPLGRIRVDFVVVDSHAAESCACWLAAARRPLATW